MFYSIKKLLTTKCLATSFYIALFALLTINVQAFAVDIVLPTDSLEQPVEKQEDTPKDANWLHLEPSIRPAYVGIHGGTAPITLFRGSDGSVYAITGQTGNDFILALRNGNASAQKPSDTSIAEVSTLDEQESMPHFSDEAIKEDISVYERWGDSTQWMATLKSYSMREKNEELPTDEIIQPKPKDYPDVVFTSGEKFKDIDQKSDTLKAFGFSDNDMPPATRLNGTRFSDKALILELKDYRDILGRL